MVPVQPTLGLFICTPEDLVQGAVLGTPSLRRAVEMKGQYALGSTLEQERRQNTKKLLGGQVSQKIAP